MIGSSQEKVVGQPADKQESDDTATRIFKDNRGKSKRKNKGKRAKMGEEK